MMVKLTTVQAKSAVRKYADRQKTIRLFATIRIIKGGVHDFRGLSAILNFL